MEECMENLNFELAEKLCNQAVEMSPDNQQALNLAASVFLEVGKTEKAADISFWYSLALVLRAFPKLDIIVWCIVDRKKCLEHCKGQKGWVSNYKKIGLLYVM